MALKFRFPNAPFIRCLFTGKHADFCDPGGNISFKADAGGDAVRPRRNLLVFCQKRGMEGWAECAQVHGVNIHAPDQPVDIMARSWIEADGMMTDVPGLGLMIKTADCQPLLLAHKSGRRIMALHVGWRGNRANFPALGLRAFCCAYHLDPADILAVRGPSLGPDHARFTAFDSEWGPAFRPWFNEENQTMNLWALTKSQLLQSGARPENIFEFPICTYAGKASWFSWRRREAGRQAALIWIANPNIREHS